MSVKIGHASSSETGKITGGKAGDQTGREVFTRNWYKKSQGWRVFRPKDPVVAENIAKCMEMACANNKIGYDQNQRNTLYNAAKPFNFDVSKVTKAVETDCSALVRVCCAYAGIMLDDFNTASEPARLLASGAFEEMTGSKYTDHEDYLTRGMILCTRSKGHTLVILSDGDKVEGKVYALGDRLLKRTNPLMKGDDVKDLQTRLNGFGFDCGKADGEFGKNTEKAVKAFQDAANIEVDGKVGAESVAALRAFKSVSEYTVQVGDSLWKISEKLLGSGSRYREIVELNNLAGSIIKPGQVLKIPLK